MHLPTPPPEPGKWKAAAESTAVFALTMFALLWGVSFSFGAATPPPIVQQVSLLPQLPQPAPLPPPPPKAEKAEKPKAEKPKAAPKPAPPKPEPKPAPDADIALKQKEKEEEEKRRREEEERKKREQQKREEEEAKQEKEEAERKKREEAERKQREEEAQKQREEEEQRRKDEEQRRLEAEERRRIAEQERIERENAARIAHEIAIDGERQLIKGQMRGRIERAHIHPASVPDDADIEVIVVFRLITIDTGRAELREPPEIIKSSGNAEYDESVWRAIIKTGVFPFPKSPELAEEFLDITLHMSPRDR